MIASIAAYYHLTPNYVLDEMTMEDLVMYAKVIPPYDTDKATDGAGAGAGAGSEEKTIEAGSMSGFAQMVQRLQADKHNG